VKSLLPVPQVVVIKLQLTTGKISEISYSSCNVKCRC